MKNDHVYSRICFIEKNVIDSRVDSKMKQNIDKKSIILPLTRESRAMKYKFRPKRDGRAVAFTLYMGMFAIFYLGGGGGGGVVYLRLPSRWVLSFGFS